MITSREGGLISDEEIKKEFIGFFVDTEQVRPIKDAVKRCIKAQALHDKQIYWEELQSERMAWIKACEEYSSGFSSVILGFKEG